MHNCRSTEGGEHLVDFACLCAKAFRLLQDEQRLLRTARMASSWLLICSSMHNAVQYTRHLDTDATGRTWFSVIRPGLIQLDQQWHERCVHLGAHLLRRPDQLPRRTQPRPGLRAARLRGGKLVHEPEDGISLLGACVLTPLSALAGVNECVARHLINRTAAHTPPLAGMPRRWPAAGVHAAPAAGSHSDRAEHAPMPGRSS